MKKSLIALAALATVATAAQAQSVTFYGRLDTGVRAQGNQTGGKTSVAAVDGILGGSRWGMEGTEDVGNGVKAFFRIESGFNPSKGTVSATDSKDAIGGTTATTLFDRQSYVGLNAGQLGQVKFGRDNTFAYDAIAAGVLDITGGALDGQGGGAALADTYKPNAALSMAATTNGTRRLSNLVKYTNTINGVDVGAMYSIGGKAGDTSANTVWGYNLGYKIGSLNAVATYQINQDYVNKELTYWNVGATYGINALTLQAAFHEMRADAGYNGVTAALPLVSPATTAQPGFIAKLAGAYNTSTTSGKARLTTVGAAYAVSPALKVTGAYYHVDQSGTTDGSVDSYIAMATYNLSKRTTLYATYDYQDASSGLKTATAGLKPTQHGVTTGIRHQF